MPEIHDDMLGYRRPRGKPSDPAPRPARPAAATPPGLGDGLPERPSLDGYTVHELSQESSAALLLAHAESISRSD